MSQDIMGGTIHARLRWVPRRMKTDCNLSFWNVAKNLRAGQVNCKKAPCHPKILRRPENS